MKSKKVRYIFLILGYIALVYSIYTLFNLFNKIDYLTYWNRAVLVAVNITSSFVLFMTGLGNINARTLKNAKQSVPFYFLFLISIVFLAQNGYNVLQHGFIGGEILVNQISTLCFNLFVLIFCYIKFYKFGQNEIA